MHQDGQAHDGRGDNQDGSRLSGHRIRLGQDGNPATRVGFPEGQDESEVNVLEGYPAAVCSTSESSEITAALIEKIEMSMLSIEGELKKLKAYQYGGMKACSGDLL